MEKNTKIIRMFLFNTLVILTILFIYFMFFPKKSYVKKRLDDTLNPMVEDTFNQNINTIKIVALKYFSDNADGKVFLSTFLEKNLLLELKDSNGDFCDTYKSYSEKHDNKLAIYLKCNDKERLIEEEIKENQDNESDVEKNKEKLFCLYQYEKKIKEGYTDYDEWSDWQLEEVFPDELTNVETKVEEELDGTKIITESEEVSINADRKIEIICPEGYINEESKCKKKIKSSSITASIKYSCPNGYTRIGTTCHGNDEINATKTYYCPSNQNNIEFKLSGSSCEVYNVRYTDAVEKNVYYACPSDYKLSGNKCYKTEYYESEVDNYKEVTYYRYQTRKIQDEKTVVKWSSPNDNNLLNDEYNMTIEILCEF